MGWMMARLEKPSEDIPENMRCALLVLAKHWQALDADERVLERQIAKAARCDRNARRLMEVPSVGPMIASTVLAKVPDPKVFRSGRDFAAWIGLTGKDHGTGGKHRPGRISKQGDRVLRALPISGASAHLRQQKARGVTDPWLRALLARRPYKLAMVAFAAKTARIVVSSRHVWTAPSRQGFSWCCGECIEERSCIRPRDAAIDHGP
jgi:transposase